MIHKHIRKDPTDPQILYIEMPIRPIMMDRGMADGYVDADMDIIFTLPNNIQVMEFELLGIKCSNRLPLSYDESVLTKRISVVSAELNRVVAIRKYMNDIALNINIKTKHTKFNNIYIKKQIGITLLCDLRKFIMNEHSIDIVSDINHILRNKFGDIIIDKYRLNIDKYRLKVHQNEQRRYANVVLILLMLAGACDDIECYINTLKEIISNLHNKPHTVNDGYAFNNVVENRVVHLGHKDLDSIGRKMYSDGYMIRNYTIPAIYKPKDSSTVYGSFGVFIVKSTKNDLWNIFPHADERYGTRQMVPSWKI